MKVKNLIKILSGFDPELNVDINDNNGGYYGISDVKLQQWEEGKGKVKHASVAICHGPYVKADSVV